jgi:hypothetical protein
MVALPSKIDWILLGGLGTVLPVFGYVAERVHHRQGPRGLFTIEETPVKSGGAPFPLGKSVDLCRTRNKHE